MKFIEQTDTLTVTIAALAGCKPDSGLVNALNDLRAEGRIRDGMSYGDVYREWLAAQTAYWAALKKRKARVAVLVRNVREFAEANYEKDGWDFLVECWTDDDIAETIGDARTKRDAIARCREVVQVQDDRRTDICNA